MQSRSSEPEPVTGSIQALRNVCLFTDALTCQCSWIADISSLKSVSSIPTSSESFSTGLMSYEEQITVLLVVTKVGDGCCKLTLKSTDRATGSRATGIRDEMDAALVFSHKNKKKRTVPMPFLARKVFILVPTGLGKILI